MGPLCYIFLMGVQREVNGEKNDGKVDLSRGEREEGGERLVWKFKVVTLNHNMRTCASYRCELGLTVGGTAVQSWHQNLT